MVNGLPRGFGSTRPNPQILQLSFMGAGVPQYLLCSSTRAPQGISRYRVPRFGEARFWDAGLPQDLLLPQQVRYGGKGIPNRLGGMESPGSGVLHFWGAGVPQYQLTLSSRSSLRDSSDPGDLGVQDFPHFDGQFLGDQDTLLPTQVSQAQGTGTPQEIWSAAPWIWGCQVLGYQGMPVSTDLTQAG